MIDFFNGVITARRTPENWVVPANTSAGNFVDKNGKLWTYSTEGYKINVWGYASNAYIGASQGATGWYINAMKRNIENVIKNLNVEIDTEKLEDEIEKVKDDIKQLVNFRMAGDIDIEVYQEENKRLNAVLNNLRSQRDAVNLEEDRKNEMRMRIYEIEHVLGIRDRLLTEFDGEVFGALVKRVEIGEGGEIGFCIE